MWNALAVVDISHLVKNDVTLAELIAPSLL